MQITHYFDYKSPYAYLAQTESFELQSLGATVTFQPYTLDIPSYLGAAQLDDSGDDIVGARNAHQWRRVRYSYMDCRREANRQGLVIRGPRKIFDSSLAHIAFYFARDQGDFRPYHELVYDRFWRRELDIENPEVLLSVLNETGYDTQGFTDYLSKEGRERHDAERAHAETMGIFGVPSYMIENELFWGAERLERIRELLTS